MQALTTYVTTPFAKIFLALIFMLVVPLLFSALVVGVAEMGDVRALGRIGWRRWPTRCVLSAIAVLLGLVLVNWLQPGAGVDPALAQQLLAENAERAKAIVSQRRHAAAAASTCCCRIVPDNVVARGVEQRRSWR